MILAIVKFVSVILVFAAKKIKIKHFLPLKICETNELLKE